MKLIKISTDMELSIHDFPDGNHSKQNRELRELIGNGCNLYEHVMPERLYTDLKMKNRPTKIPGQCVSMLIDEEGRLKENVPKETFKLLELELNNMIYAMKATKEAMKL